MTMEMTQAEEDAIMRAREAGVPADELVKRATASFEADANKDKDKDKGAAAAKAGDAVPFNAAGVSKVVQDALTAHTQQMANEKSADDLRRSLRATLKSNPRLANSPKWVDRLAEGFESNLTKYPDFVKALNDPNTSPSDLDAALATAVTAHMEKELADIDELTGAASDEALDTALQGKKDATVASGGARANQGDSSTVTHSKMDELVDNPVFGMGVPQPTDLELETAKNEDLAAFGRKHKVNVSELIGN